MTHTDFIHAISRYCKRLVGSNAKPESVSLTRAALHDFLREVDRERTNMPGLFEHPAWGGRWCRSSQTITYPPGGLPLDDLESAVLDAMQSLAPDVVRIRYTVGDDWNGHPAIHFRVVLSDEASRRPILLATTNRIGAALRAKLDFKAMGLRDYYNFRNVSEQAALKDEDWE